MFGGMKLFDPREGTYRVRADGSGKGYWVGRSGGAKR